MTNLNYQTMYPDRFEKQKVSLVVNIFNEKTVAVLQQNGFADTACFVRQVTKMWNILNVKSPKAAVRLNDPNRKPFSDKDDTRLQFLQSMATSFSEMNPRSVPGQMRKQMLTIDTSEALSLTLNGLVSLIQTLLDKGFSYVKCRVTDLRANLVSIVQPPVLTTTSHLINC